MSKFVTNREDIIEYIYEVECEVCMEEVNSILNSLNNCCIDMKFERGMINIESSKVNDDFTKVINFVKKYDIDFPEDNNDSITNMIHQILITIRHKNQDKIIETFNNDYKIFIEEYKTECENYSEEEFNNLLYDYYDDFTYNLVGIISLNGNGYIERNYPNIIKRIFNKI